MTRASTVTTLHLGEVAANIALFKTTGDPPRLPLEDAGPNGGALRKEERPRTSAVEATDALADEQNEADRALISRLEAKVAEYEEGAANARTALAARTPTQVETETVFTEEGTGEIVERPRKGIRRADGKWVDLTDALERIDNDIAAQGDMRVLSFIDVGAVPRERVVGSYYVGVGGFGAGKVLRLLYEAMKAKRRVAVVRWVKTKNIALGVVVPYRESLLVLELSYAETWRAVPPEALITGASVSSTAVSAATQLIEAMSQRPVDLETLEDDRYRQRAALIENAATALPGEAEAEAKEALDEGVEDAAAHLAAALEHAG